MKSSLISVLLLAFLSAPALGVKVTTNDSPIYDQAPQNVKEVKNGRLETVGQGDDAIQIVHVWGTPYEMGYAHGELLKKEINNQLDITNAMLKEVGGDPSILDKVWESVKPHVSAYFVEELKGLSDATGIELQTLIRSNMIGEASEWHCSLFGVWGEATKSSGHLLQLRALDYAVHAGIQKYPVITVYHPNADNGHAFANIGWAGMLGSVTGISSQQLAISEIGDDYDKNNDTFDGIPFTFLLRDILQFDKSLDEATARIKNAPRTTSLLYAVGDGKIGQARSYQASHTICNVYDSANLEPLTSTHQRIPDAVYWGMSWDVPAYSGPLHDMLQKHYGKIDGEVTVREILPTVGTGNLQVAVYDLTDMKVWTANAGADGEGGPLNAYQRPYVKLDMKALFSEQAPSSKQKTASKN
jgi:hypothetical protein